jgi:hypothetical protein
MNVQVNRAKTVALIGNTNNNAVGFYSSKIRELIRQNSVCKDLFNCIIYSAQFRDFSGNTTLNWNFNSSKLANAYLDVLGNGAQKIAFCEPAMHLLLSPKAILIPILDLADAIISFFREKKITKVACLGIEGQLLQRYFYEISRQGITLFLIDKLYNECSTESEKINFITTLPLRKIEAILLHNRPQLETFLRSIEVSIPIFITWSIHSHAIAKSILDDSL